VASAAEITDPRPRGTLAIAPNARTAPASAMLVTQPSLTV
jgi:hypothetical protein